MTTTDDHQNLSGGAYINGDDGYPWLSCGGCDERLMFIDAGDTLAALRAALAEHACPVQRATGQGADLLPLPGRDKVHLLAYLAAAPDWSHAETMPNGVEIWDHIAGDQATVPGAHTGFRNEGQVVAWALRTVMALALEVHQELGLADALCRLGAVLSCHERSGEASPLCRCGERYPCATRTAARTPTVTPSDSCHHLDWVVSWASAAGSQR